MNYICLGTLSKDKLHMSIKLYRYRSNLKGLLFYISYKIAHSTCKNKFIHLILFPIWLTYRLIFNWILGIDISEYTQIGKGLVVWHGMGLVINPLSKIGNDVILRHNTTIGSARHDNTAPIIEDRVDIGCGVIIIGAITIGHDSIIGAGSVITKSIPPNSVVVGNPGRIIRTIELN